ncbi:MAG: hypothetical protein AAFR88_02935 [Pseudomonadota bacterium]
MGSQLTKPLACGSALLAYTFLSSAPLAAQEVSLNYDRLASLEEPIAIDLGNATLQLQGVLDAPLIAEFDEIADDDSIEAEFIGNFQVSFETQLKNRWTVGAVYFGQYSTDPSRVFLTNFLGMDDYNDNVAGFVATSFGTVIGGNVNQQVRELTRRRRGVGNGFLAFDDFYGQLDRWGGAYTGRFGPSTIGVAVDENGDFEVGAVFQRPIGQRDLRFSGRFRQSRFTAGDGITEIESQGVGAVGEIEYGSSVFDLGAGLENLDAPGEDALRWFVSAGAQTQIGQIRLSGEAHYGEVEGDQEVSAGLGLGYDVARGLSLNLGLNYQDAQVVSGAIPIRNLEEGQAVASVRFSF